MFFSRLFKKKKQQQEPEEKKPDISQGIYYLYLIIGIQVLFVFGLMAVIITLGRVLATPLWVFLFSLAMGGTVCYYIYKKAQRQFRKMRDALKHVDLSARNYEISFMGGMLTMKVEHNPRKLLEDHSNTVVDTETLDASTAAAIPPKVAGLSR